MGAWIFGIPRKRHQGLGREPEHDLGLGSPTLVPPWTLWR